MTEFKCFQQIVDIFIVDNSSKTNHAFYNTILNLKVFLKKKKKTQFKIFKMIMLYYVLLSKSKI